LHLFSHHKTIDSIDSNRPAQQIVAGNAYWTLPSESDALLAAFLNSALCRDGISITTPTHGSGKM
jgi:hypothetical protein